MSIEDLGRMKECDHTEYRRIYDKHMDNLSVFSSYSGGIFGMPEMSTAWGIKGHETALIASECANWEHRREDPEAWTYWKNADLVAALDREADYAALEARCAGLERERDALQAKMETTTSELESIRAMYGARCERHCAVRDKMAAAEEALRWYADTQNYDSSFTAVLLDNGRAAREALATIAGHAPTTRGEVDE